MRALLASSLFVLLASPSVHAKCARMGIAPAAITQPNTAIPEGGGVLVGLTYERGEGGSEEAEQPTWRFKQGGSLVEPKIRTIAPGLAVYEITGDGTLVDAKGKALVAVKRGKAQPALPAPKLGSATTSFEGDLTERWGRTTMLDLQLAGDPPAGAIGLIVYQDGKPVNWSGLEPKSKSVSFRSGGHCSNDLPGTLVPILGQVTIAWFDASGRVSPMSPAVALKSKPKK